MSATPPTTVAWGAEIRRRVGVLWATKCFGTMGWIGAFFLGYFWVLQNPLAEAIVMPVTALDTWITFRPEALVLYVSLWFYVSIVPALAKDFRELFSYGMATLAMSLIGLGIFLAWPTTVPAFELDLSGHPSMSMLKGVDLAGNACPSLHVSFAVFTGIWLDRMLREIGTPRALRIASWVWCYGIVYSTVATRQHVVLDVVAGVALGIVVAVVYARVLGWLEAGRARTAERASLERLSG